MMGDAKMVGKQMQSSGGRAALGGLLMKFPSGNEVWTGSGWVCGIDLGVRQCGIGLFLDLVRRCCPVPGTED